MLGGYFTDENSWPITRAGLGNAHRLRSRSSCTSQDALLVMLMGKLQMRGEAIGKGLAMEEVEMLAKLLEPDRLWTHGPLWVLVQSVQMLPQSAG